MEWFTWSTVSSLIIILVLMIIITTYTTRQIWYRGNGCGESKWHTGYSKMTMRWWCSGRKVHLKRVSKVTLLWRDVSCSKAVSFLTLTNLKKSWNLRTIHPFAVVWLSECVTDLTDLTPCVFIRLHSAYFTLRFILLRISFLFCINSLTSQPFSHSICWCDGEG